MLTSKSSLANEKGMAVFELIPILFIYMLLINFALGFFGIVHSGILHNIAARNYTFETFSHRSNLVFHIRASQEDISRGSHFATRGYRFSGVIFDEASDRDSEWVATARPIAFASSFGGTDQDGVNLSNRSPSGNTGEAQIHNQGIQNLNESVRNESVGVKSVWIKTIYGICIDSRCGD